MNTISNQAGRNRPFLSMTFGAIIQCRFPLEFGGKAERNSSFSEIAIAFYWIKFNLQDLIVCTNKTSTQLTISPNAGQKELGASDEVIFGLAEDGA